MSAEKVPSATPGLHPELESLLAYWFVKCAGRKIPARASLPVREWGRWRSNLALFDVLHYGALRIYECRQSAEGLLERLGNEPAGLCTDALPQDIRAELRAGFENAWRRRAPYIAQVRVANIAPGGPQNVRYSDLILPLSDNGTNIDGMLLGSYPLP